MALRVLVLAAAATAATAQTIAGYGPVNLDDVSPLTLSWNQVHYLVRDNLLEIDQLRAEHEDLYRELQSCFGLERCLRGSGVVDMDVGECHLYFPVRDESTRFLGLCKEIHTYKSTCSHNSSLPLQSR
jgi:hypothetical protein